MAAGRRRPSGGSVVPWVGDRHIDKTEHITELVENLRRHGSRHAEGKWLSDHDAHVMGVQL